MRRLVIARMWIRIQVLNYILQKCLLSIEKTENEWKEAVYGPNYEYFAAICCAWMLNYVLCSVSSAAKPKNAIADQIFNSTIYLPYGLRLNKCGMAMAELQINTP